MQPGSLTPRGVIYTISCRKVAAGLRTLLFFLAAPLLAAEYKAGIAKIDITPKEPIYMSGYATRNHPSEGVTQHLFAKALAIEDGHGTRVVIVTTDLIGLPRAISDPVAAEAAKRWGIDRAHLMFNSSHTHTGPLLLHNLNLMFELSEAEAAAVERYTRQLSEDLITVVGGALQDLQPARVWLGNGAAHFAVNRRQFTPNGVKIGVNPQGPTDPDVPVLKVTAPDGRVRAVLAGYACHNTTLTGEFYQITGDYAGYAQAELEKAYPGATALFLQLCGGDQNPNPRSTMQLAEQHGAALAAEVKRVLDGRLAPVRGPIRAAFQIVDLGFAYHTRQQFEARLTEKNVWRVRHARAMLRTYDEGRPIRTYPYPVQALAFGKALTVLALGGEVVVDYDLRVKKEFGATGMIVAGYSNDVMAYIASKRVLKEGGYEADDSMIYYGQPGPWAEDVEERIFTTIHQVMKRVGRKG